MTVVVPRTAIWRDPRRPTVVGRWDPPPPTPGQVKLRVEAIPCRDQARALVRAMHRHLPKAPCADKARFVVRCPDMYIRGVAILGRPTARLLAVQGRVLEVTRVATDGTPNACSALLGACCRWARKRGYHRVVTYTLSCEGGASLRGAGFSVDGHTTGGHWDRAGRERDERPDELETPKVRWVRVLKP